jgi:hypothetical protein
LDQSNTEVNSAKNRRGSSRSSSSGGGIKLVVRKAVAQAFRSKNEPWAPVIRFNLHADSPHDHVNIVTIDVGIVSPHCFDNGIPVVHDALMKHKEFHNFEFQSCHGNILATDSYLAGFPMQFQIPYRNDRPACDDVKLDLALYA